MNVLVTGGAGFIGSHLLRELLASGHVVRVLDSFDDSYDPEIKRRNIAGLPLDLIEGDIRSSETVADALKDIDLVVHLAAKAGVRESLRTPLLYEEVNVQGTMVLLEELRKQGRARMVFASSSSVYGARQAGPFAESDAADAPVSPYAATKRSGELLCHAAHAGWGLEVSCLRFFTVYGPRQRPAMAISRFVRGIIEGEVLSIYGDGSSTRDYTWVGDVVRGILAAVNGPSVFGIYNIGCGQPIRLDDLVQLISDEVGREARIRSLPNQPGDVPMTFARNDKARQILGWTPEMELREGIARTVDWMRSELGAIR